MTARERAEFEQLLPIQFISTSAGLQARMRPEPVSLDALVAWIDGKITAAESAAAQVERERILALLRVERDRYFHVGEMHSNGDVRYAAMSSAASWNLSINLIEEDSTPVVAGEQE
jgi:hypothetical protein